jgi:excisionase family DNA binding protein
MTRPAKAVEAPRRRRHPREETVRPLVFDVVGAAHQLAISERQVRTLVDEGQLRALKSGRRLVITDEELQRYVAQLPAARDTA